MNFNNKTVTVLNRLKASDSLTRQDIWYKTIIPNCCWYTSLESGIAGNVITMGSKYKVLIPFSDKFLPYNEWKQVGNQDNHYTMSETDVIILGEVTDDVTSQNIKSIKSQFEPSVCEVKSVTINENRSIPGVIYQLSCNGV